MASKIIHPVSPLTAEKPRLHKATRSRNQTGCFGSPGRFVGRGIFDERAQEPPAQKPPGLPEPN